MTKEVKIQRDKKLKRFQFLSRPPGGMEEVLLVHDLSTFQLKEPYVKSWVML